jgi:hypothetical protein
MNTIRPAVFSDSLPAKPNYVPQSQRAAAGTASGESNSVVKILLAFLVVAVLGNLALTLFLNRSKESSTMVESTVKENKLIDELAQIRAELAHNRVALANGTAEIARMKVAYQTVIAQIGTPVNAGPSRYSSSEKSDAAKLNQPAANKSGEHSK